ncbi:homocysteine S-methyltransferase family protein [Ruminococcus sp. Marseille-P6503]|uniref:homocysteine S-methyltransferase family protein n=1 Tax=Ruminococcus sp. Marseille-P6503 TaxID=2364796 RepID=UPI000F52030A|nr:homocysteine S-methyltransferase family protein [Ruminococcus sp. Marseille-P6503]
MDFKTLLKKDFVFLDGAMGTMLQAKGLKMGVAPETLNIEKPEWLIDIHRQYIEAGADIIYANTFGANRYKLGEYGYSVKEATETAIENAKAARGDSEVLIALDIGPIGQLLEPAGTLSFEEAYDIFKEMVIAGSDCDIIVFETMTDLYELKAAVLAAKENSSKPVVCTMTFEENMRTFTGCGISSMALTLEGLGADAIGVNCSLGPKELYPIVKELCSWTKLPVAVKPNAGLPDPVTNEYSVFPEEFAQLMKELAPLGVKMFGGCCGTSPEYIRAMRKSLADADYYNRAVKIPSACCCATNTVIIDQPRVIGERINPTGKKRFKEALLAGDIDYILGQGIEQIRAGADILDVNVGLPGIDEKGMMVRAVKSLQSVVDVPLQLDSTIPEVLEAGLRIYNGKPIVNSVNGEEKSLNSVLPLVKKYGAAVVGLCLDENGIPKSARERFEIARRIVSRAESIGIRREDVYIDCLTLTASAEQEGVTETLNAVERVKKELGCKTVLGVSNISFGLPAREIVNHNFLMMALTKGLDLPIINPNVETMMQTVRAYKLLANIDINSADFISHYGARKAEENKPRQESADLNLDKAIENGLKSEGARITERLLENMDAMDIVNNMLIPALDKTGADFETGKIFLPQLIQSAGAAQSCFEVIKNHLAKSGEKSESKGKIIVATVKGDIHDIGKNIVKVLLENYGYDVIDLGKDVDCQRVVDCAVENGVHLVGLSALMTTTLASMEETIRLLRENNVDCKVMVGGAVLTAEYAEKIGADFYAKDAKESCDIAKKVLG